MAERPEEKGPTLKEQLWGPRGRPEDTTHHAATCRPGDRPHPPHACLVGRSRARSQSTASGTRGQGGL